MLLNTKRMLKKKLSDISDIVAARMAELGYSQNALARVADMNQPTIYKILAKANKDISLSTLLTLANGLQLTLTQIIAESPINSRQPLAYPEVKTPPSPEAIAISRIWDNLPESHRSEILAFIRVWSASKATSSADNSEPRHKSA